MYVFIIFLCTGISVFVLISGTLMYIGKAKMERRLSGKFSDISKHRYIGLKGIIIYSAEKIGKALLTLRIKYLSNYIIGIERNLSFLNRTNLITDSYGVLGMQVILAIVFISVGISVFEISNLLFLAVFALVGLCLPFLYVNEKVKTRNLRIFNQLSEFLDALTLMVEAGLDLNLALNRILNTYHGDLIDEFKVVGDEIMLGKSRVRALSDLYKNTSESHLKSVLNGLIVSIKTGKNMSLALRGMAEQFRLERTQILEKKAHEAPVKMMVPMVLFIFPTIFIVLFGPIIISFIGGGYF